MGPALIDRRWTYGSEPGDIYDTIVQVRPNGMPAFDRSSDDSVRSSASAFGPITDTTDHAPVTSTSTFSCARMAAPCAASRMSPATLPPVNVRPAVARATGAHAGRPEVSGRPVFVGGRLH